MAVWVVKAGRHGEQEETALKGFAVIGWAELPDLSGLQDREVLRELMKQTYPTVGENTLSNWTGQVWGFRARIQEGDIAVLPLKHRAEIAIGRFIGPYEYHPEDETSCHRHRVEWLKTDIPRATFDQDLLYSFGAFMTVCQVSRNNAEERLLAILENRKVLSAATLRPEPNDLDLMQITDVAEDAEERIRAYIEHKFKGHALAQLVQAVLQATGYTTALSPPGPDGGVDIIAGRGPMGFEAPKLCVQVKSSSSPAGVDVLRGLHGTMRTFGAEQGLLVSWGGFKETVRSEAKAQFFSIRLWDSVQLIQSMLENYERLSSEIQASLPLKRIWILVE